jgi:hypothetical protein
MSDQVTTSGKKAPKVQAFLAAIRVCPSVTRAARAAGVDRREHYRRYKADPVYAKVFDEAWAMGVAFLEDAVTERAQEGVEEPVIYQGVVTYHRDGNGDLVRDEEGRPIPLTIRKYSVEREKLVLAAAKPEKYRTNHHVEANVTHAGIAGLPDQELERIVREAAHHAGGSGGGAAPEAEGEESAG